ncbi:Hsp20/alpha crystallin family protein [Pseudalkalibacillus caeni]|uniref:Hsp20/alpha crystallin family protein n=1 Tax=Exobacillus caeni TaxID=2574798 RepID=A0A5R9F1T8_9BACL|nr:Hsp20/alpha crystallin family protein [Pseudalkalibacillus caeni]TLS37547.1 Hsp20/alpha crystallin family protein [Pseudalkalibacillus caeni]
MASKKDKLPKIFEDPVVKQWLNSFDDFWKDPFQNFFPGRSFRVDIYETNADVIVEAEIPGVKREQIDVEVLNEGIRISVENDNRIEEINENHKYYRKERSYERMERIVPLPYHVSPKNTKARYQNGVLEVRIPKSDIKGNKQRFLDIE